MSPSLEGMTLLTTRDLATPAEWGDSPSPAREGMAVWATTPARKHASSGDHECPRGHKSVPSILLGSCYEVLAGSEVGVDMDVELGFLSSFLDGYEYVSRELMYAPVAGGGGRGVPRVPLKLDVLYASFASRVFLERAPHKCFFLTRYYLAGVFRHLVVLTHVVPRADVRSLAYEAMARFLCQCPPSVSRAEALDHRALYSRLACRQVVSTSGGPAGVRWGTVSGGGAPAAVRNLHWRCALGRLPVREVLHRHRCSVSALRPRGCRAPETVAYAFWE
ncbi:hypothetical protein AAFF_G00091030 [Aldrovandia affinis]|uniref:Uncharacterized protein n=1 Tax=Aldrovandia affinis TaxID=143900 RepID=A0AAD7WBS7_9TELE|nr:hypothetical protein AAFF_G00091030 [Aldrovandia affinis]